MDELIAQITEKTGVTADKAKDMLGVTTEWMKAKLPADLSDQVTAALTGATGIASSAAGKATEAAGSAMGTASGVAATATEKAEGLWNKAKGTLSGSSDDK
jgi:uncharacterized protein YjbJ (UPF0337 family)